MISVSTDNSHQYFQNREIILNPFLISLNMLYREASIHDDNK